LPDYDIIEADYEKYNRQINDDILDFRGAVFYHPDFLRISAEILGLEFSPLICYREEKIVGLVNLLTGHRSIFKTALIPTLFQYFGPISFIKNSEVNEQMIKYAADNFDSVILSLLPGVEANFAGWHKQDRITYMIAPDTFDNLKKNCASDIKNKANKALKAGVAIKKVDEFDYDLYNASFKRQNLKPPMQAGAMTEWADKLSQAGLAETYIAFLDNQPVAVRTLLVYNKYAYTWVSGIRPEFMSLGVNSLLILTIGEILYKRGIEIWDFGGGEIKSIGRFKKAFGATGYTHLQIEKNSNWKGALYRALMNMKAGIHD